MRRATHVSGVNKPPFSDDSLNSRLSESINTAVEKTHGENTDLYPHVVYENTHEEEEEPSNTGSRKERI